MTTKKPRAAIYARYSTDGQRLESLEDQFRVCERVADAQGFEVVARFSDAAISAGTADRPEYQAMLTAARARKFDILIAEDISRLWRNRAEYGPRSAELEDLKVNLVTAVGDDTRKDGWGLLITIKQAIAEHERRQSAYRTRRGLEGKAKAGAHAGGKSFGFRSIDKKRVVDEEQAAIVKKIFEWRASGWSGQRIARQLNAENVASPGATWARTDAGPNRKTKSGWRSSAILGDPRKGVGILNNPLYAGRIVWGRTKWTRSAADSSHRTASITDPSTWITHIDESLRIVSDQLWEAVQKIQTTPSARGDAIRRGIAKRRNGKDSRYLLGSILQCTCGSNYIGHGKKLYHCFANHSGNCDNSLMFNRQEANEAVHALVRDHLSSDRQIELGRAYVERMLREREETEAARDRGIERGDDVRKLDEQLAALRKLSLPPAAMHAAVDAIERERASLLSARAGRRGDVSAKARALLDRLPEIVSRYLARIEKGTKTLADDASIADAREALRGLIDGGRIVLKPTDARDALAGPVKLRGLGEFAVQLGGVSRGKSLNCNVKDYVVAGAGFEPATFGL